MFSPNHHTVGLVGICKAVLTSNHFNGAKKDNEAHKYAPAPFVVLC